MLGTGRIIIAFALEIAAHFALVFFKGASRSCVGKSE